MFIHPDSSEVGNISGNISCNEFKVHYLCMFSIGSTKKIKIKRTLPKWIGSTYSIQAPREVRLLRHPHERVGKETIVSYL